MLHHRVIKIQTNPSTEIIFSKIIFIDYQIPHTAACWLLSNGQTAVFSLAYQTTLLLFNMNCVTGQTVSTELKQHYIVPRIFSNITGALRFDFERDNDNI